MDTQEKYYILIHKEFSGEISNQEKDELNSWINYSNENRDEYNFFQQKLNAVTVPEPKIKFDIDSEWKALEERINSGDQKRSIFSNFKHYGIAASILVIIGLSIFFNQLDQGFTKIKNIVEDKQKITLPDNSTILLSKGSEIEYRYDETIREVNLKGRAYFIVNKDEKKFIVNTENAKIEVLGTKFNVDTRGNYSSVAVKSGKVLFANSKKENVILVFNQFSECYSDSVPTNPAIVNVDSLISWTDTKLVFENKSLQTVLHTLENEFMVKYEYSNSDILKNKLSAVFENESIDVIHKSISTALKISITKKGDIYYIKK